MKLVADAWVENSCEQTEIDNPTIDQIEVAIDKLDQKQHTIITLQMDDEKNLTIGGGNGQYVVYLGDGNESFRSLVKGDDVHLVSVNAGGQQGDYPAKKVVDNKTAKKAATFFSQHALAAPDLQWIDD
jgi:hypothetical protein